MGIRVGCFPRVVLGCSTLMGIGKGNHHVMEQGMINRTVSRLALIN